MAAPLLRLDDLHGWYGESHILRGVGLEVRAGEVVSLLGRNGAGKTTTLKAIMGLLARRTGSIGIAGIETISLRSDRIARLGVGYCPEDRGIFASLSVAENLTLPPVVAEGGLDLAAIHALFPALRARAASQGGSLSGGEQQMLAIARILRTGARLLLLDEPTEGLSPVMVAQIGQVLREVRARGFTVLLVEQNFRFAASLADRHYVMADGRIIEHIGRADLPASMERLGALLGV